MSFVCLTIAKLYVLNEKHADPSVDLGTRSDSDPRIHLSTLIVSIKTPSCPVPGVTEGGAVDASREWIEGGASATSHPSKFRYANQADFR